MRAHATEEEPAGEAYIGQQSQTLDPYRPMTSTDAGTGMMMRATSQLGII